MSRFDAATAYTATPTVEALQALLARCARRDHGAFEQLYRLTSPKLFALCAGMLRRDDLAEEVLQDAFVQIWRQADRFDRSRASPMTWMAVIVRHRAIDVLRKGLTRTLYEGLVVEAEGFARCKGKVDYDIGMKNFIQNGPRVPAVFMNE